MRPDSLRVQFRVRVAALYSVVCVALVAIGLARHGVERALYPGLAIVCATTLIAEHWKERALVRDHKSALAVVTEYAIRLRGTPHLWQGVPRIKYYFVANDHNVYTGEAGWNVRGLFHGAQLPVLYRSSNPGSNLPLQSFMFYSFQ